MTLRERLDTDARDYCDELFYEALAEYMKERANKVNIRPFVNYNKIWRWRKVVSSCCYTQNKIVHDCNKGTGNVVWEQRMLDAYKREFNKRPGENCGKEGYKLGRCAEQRAANQLLHIREESYDNNNTPKEIREILFSTAYQPKTAFPVPACSNCKTLFGL